jgi:hypothetical protein
VLLGPDELARGGMAVKDLETGAQAFVAVRGGGGGGLDRESCDAAVGGDAPPSAAAAPGGGAVLALQEALRDAGCLPSQG